MAIHLVDDLLVEHVDTVHGRAWPSLSLHNVCGDRILWPSMAIHLIDDPRTIISAPSPSPLNVTLCLDKPVVWCVSVSVVGVVRFVQKFKAAGPAAEMIRHTEKTRVVLSDTDVALRHAVTCGDGAYVGPHGNNLVRIWAAQVHQAGAVIGTACRSKLERFAVGQASELAWESSCEFHILQIVGREVDKRFPLAMGFDTLLRGLQAQFGFGQSKVYTRAAARKLGVKFRTVLAPRADEFKVSLQARYGRSNTEVWQTGLVYWG
jgi:hypothetical protein